MLSSHVFAYIKQSVTHTIIFPSIFLEYAQTVHASTCGDVYSFGIVLLEMIIGKRPTDPLFDGGLSIASFVERNFPGQVLHIIDPHLQEECKGLIQASAATELLEPECPTAVVLESSTRLAMPKSPIWAFISSSRRILVGFRSQWRIGIPQSWCK